MTSRAPTEITLIDGEIQCKTAYRNAAVCGMIHRKVGGSDRVPQGWDAGGKVWCYPATPPAARVIADAFGTATISPGVQDLLSQAAAITPGRRHGAADLDASPFKRVIAKPWKHQSIGGRMIESQTATMLMHDMGTGKTKTAIDAIVNLGFKRTLVVCPKAVVEVWPQQVELHAAERVRVVPLVGSTDKRIATLDYAMTVVDDPIVFVINYEAVRMKKMEKALCKIDWDLMVMDEIHRIKSASGVQSRACYRIGRHATKRLGLSGTLMPHSPMDVFGSYRFLDISIFGKSFVLFRNHYAIMGGFEGRECIGYQNQDEMREKIFSIAHQVRKEDVLDLPPTVHEDRFIDLGDKARKIYRELENDFYSEIDAGVITAANVLVKGLRLQQITSGFIGGVWDVGLAEESIATGIDAAKLNALKDILDDIPDKPLVVFARFVHDLESIGEACESAGRTIHYLRGGCNEIAAWNQAVDAGQNAVLIVQVQSGSEGIDLARACYAVYYSVGFSLGQYEQSLARLDRPGQKHSVTYIHLIARDTIDEKIHRAFVERKSVIEAILSRNVESNQ